MDLETIEYIKENNSKFLSKIKGIDDVDEIKKHTNIMLYISSINLHWRIYEHQITQT